MAKVRVRCSHCGPIVVPSDRIELTAAPGRPMAPDHAQYAFTCTTCGGYSQRPVDSHTAARLMLAGAVVREPRHPATAPSRPPHPEDPPAGPPLTYDDLLDLHLLLERGEPQAWRL